MSFKTEAFVLKIRPWREADQLYYLFTRQEGIIKAVLKSAAKSSSKLSGHLVPLSKVRVMIGRGKLDHMAGAEVINSYGNLRKDLKHMSLANSVIELLLLDESLGHKEKEFTMLEQVFDLLDDPDTEIERKIMLVRVFLWKYLSHLGWQPELDKCLICNKKIKTGKYVPGRGIICIEHPDPGIEANGRLLEFLRFIITAEWSDILYVELDQKNYKYWAQISSDFYQTVYDKPSQSLKLYAYG